MRHFKKMILAVISVLALSSVFEAAFATPVTLTFNNFASIYSNPPPAEQVSVNFAYTLNQLNEPALTNFHMKIAETTYGMADLEWVPFNFVLIAGGSNLGIFSGQLGTNDFYFAFNTLDYSNSYLWYTVAGTIDYWASDKVISIANGVPEPSTFALIALSLAALGFSRKIGKQIV
jgi:hypothetical protein